MLTIIVMILFLFNILNHFHKSFNKLHKILMTQISKHTRSNHSLSGPADIFKVLDPCTVITEIGLKSVIKCDNGQQKKRENLLTPCKMKIVIHRHK